MHARGFNERRLHCNHDACVEWPLPCLMTGAGGEDLSAQARGALRVEWCVQENVALKVDRKQDDRVAQVLKFLFPILIQLIVLFTSLNAVLGLYTGWTNTAFICLKRDEEKRRRDST
ncbi:hypothetical protein SKAU_G00320520 [Synaphobranchus kaupii]|uniref:Uncharacterized protein n=1 Tax=Synaphobranchus kaupii TaxID=118154 RepID=A0A9Q1ENM5_SYNKA|nr:hypothetical protein SKAU_G00320520 [Synaphobranchus kaupii]